MAGEIRRGHIFYSREEKYWQQSLLEGHGVVVISLGAEFIAYGDSHNADLPEGSDTLSKNLAGARHIHVGRAFLVTREGGRLVWRTEI